MPPSAHPPMSVTDAAAPGQRFLATTPGLSATRWLSFALASRGDVFVSHGRHPLDSIIKGDALAGEESDDRSSFVSGVELADFYAQSSLEGIFTAYEKAMPGARAWGNVHGFTITSLLAKARPLSKLRGINLINVTRHPIVYIDSHYRLVQKSQAYPQVHRHYADNMFPQALRRFPQIKQVAWEHGDQLLAFAVSCYSVYLGANEYYCPLCQHLRMEDLTSDLTALRGFCQDLTGLEYRPEHLEPLMARGAINRHRDGKGSRDPRQVWDSWEPWQRDLARLIIPTHLMDEAQALGYAMDMLRPQGRGAPPPRPVIGPPLPESGDRLGRMFAAGNYAGVALAGQRERWETHAALGLIGKTEDALGGLKAFDHQQAKFYQGVALWIAGREREALNLLRHIPTEHARNLCGFMLKPQISVLAQMPGERMGGASDFVSFLPGNGRFRLRNISAHPQDLPLDPEARVEDYLEAEGPPDFFIAKMVEWHLPPINLTDMPCPVFGHTGDYDLHIQGALPWLRRFDELVVTDQTEWEDVSRLTPAPVSTFPKSFGVHPNLPPPPQGERPLDVFQSGTLLHPFHPDKAPALRQALGLPPDKRVWLADYFMPPQQYNQALGLSKASFTFVRHPGAMPTRGLEALAMGCAVVTQEGSSLSLFAGEDEGLLTYRANDDSLGQALARITGAWPDFQPRALKGAEIIRREFNLPKVADQYLRYLTFLAAKPRAPRPPRQEPPPVSKRMVMIKGWLPGPPALVERATRANQERWEARLREGSADLATFIDLGRELVLQYLYDQSPRTKARGGAPARPRDLARGLEVMRQGLARYPDSLALRFNLIRACLHLGGQDDVRQGLELLAETLAAPAESWSLDPMDDVFPWDCFSSFFNYRAYLELAASHPASQGAANSKLVRLILASLWFYYSHYSGDQGDAARAASLDPSFSFYRYRLACLLSASPRPQESALAGGILVRVAGEMLLFEEANTLLEEMEKRGVYRARKGAQLAHYRRMLEQSRQIGAGSQSPKAQTPWKEDTLRPYGGPLPQLRPLPVYHPSTPDPQEKLSILIPTLNRPDFLWRALCYYRDMGFRGWIIVGDSSSGECLEINRRRVAQVAPRLKTMHLHLPSPPYLHDGMCQKEMARRAVTPYVVYAGDDDLLAPAGLAYCVEFLETHPDFVSAHGMRVNIKVEGDKPWGQVTFAHLVRDMQALSDSSVERLVNYLRVALSIQYFVHRRKAWQVMYDGVGQVPLRYLGPELLPCCLSVLQGKSKALEPLTVIFQEHENKVFKFNQVLMLGLINDPLWARSIKSVQEQVVDFMRRHLGLPQAEAGRLVESELWLHISRILTAQYHHAHNADSVLEPQNHLRHLLDGDHPLRHDFMAALAAIAKPAPETA